MNKTRNGEILTWITTITMNKTRNRKIEMWIKTRTIRAVASNKQLQVLICVSLMFTF